MHPEQKGGEGKEEEEGDEEEGRGKKGGGEEEEIISLNTPFPFPLGEFRGYGEVHSACLGILSSWLPRSFHGLPTVH